MAGYWELQPFFAQEPPSIAFIVAVVALVSNYESYEMFNHLPEAGRCGRPSEESSEDSDAFFAPSIKIFSTNITTYLLLQTPSTMCKRKEQGWLP
jgi:hypothetical protein